MLDILDDAADPFAEVGDLAKDLGIIDSGDLDQATQMIQRMLAEQGLPATTYRFLVGEPDWSKKTSGGDDPEDYITQAGHIADNLTGNTGYGKLGAALGNRALGAEEAFEIPMWEVVSMRCEEGISRLFRCEIELRRPEFQLTPPNETDAFQALRDAVDFDKSGSGITGTITDVDEAIDGVRDFANKLQRPNQFLDEFSDKDVDPDVLDWRTTGGPVVPDPAEFLGKFCRVCVARRFRPDMFTINERWFSGIATEFEDLGSRPDRYRYIRIVIRPHLYLLSLRKQHRVFQDLNAVEILKQLLEEHFIYQDGDKIQAFLPRPGGKKLLGPLEIPDAAVAMTDKVGALLPGGIGQELSNVLSEDIEDWCPKRELCVQYDETDLALVERLLAEEGISFFFESAERRTVLVCCDDPYLSGRKTLTSARLPLVSRDSPPNTLAGAELAWEVTVGRKLVPSLTNLRDAHLAFPNMPPEQRAGEQPLAVGALAGGLEGAADLASQALAMGSELIGGGGAAGPLDDAKGTEDYAGLEAQHFEYPSRLVFESDEDGHLPVGADYAGYEGHPVAEHLLEGFRSRGATASGNSNSTMITPGHNIALEQAPFDVMHRKTVRAGNGGALVANPQKMLVVEAEHVIDPSLRGDFYQNRFRAIHVNLHFHPERRDKPRIDGVQTATVLDFKAQPEPSQGGNEVSIDRLHRVLCRFHWDRREKTATDVIDLPHTCWVRVARPFAGAGQGVLLAPRPGMEAVVSFFDGDPDRPIVIGCVYNGTDAPNTFHPRRAGNAQTIDQQASKLQSVLQTRSWPGSGETRGNLVSFDDHGKTEEIFLFAQRDLNEKVRFDHLTTVLTNQFNRVGGDHKEEAGGDQTLHVTRAATGPEDWSRTTTIFENETVEIGKEGGLQRRDEVVHGNEKIDIGADRKEAVLENETIEIKGENAGERPARLLEIHGNSTVKIREDDDLKVDGERIEKAAKAFTVKATEIKMGPPKPDGTRDEDVGLDVDEKGISLRSKGTIDLAAGEDVLVKSETNRVLVRGKTKVTIQRGADVIVLDALDETIHIRANADGGLRLGTNECYLELKNNEIVLAGAGTTWTTNGDDKTTSKIEAGGVVTWNMEGEIHLNGADVKAQGG